MNEQIEIDECFFLKKILPYIENNLEGQLKDFIPRHLLVCKQCSERANQIQMEQKILSDILVEKVLDDESYDEIKREVKELLGQFFKEVEEKRKESSPSIFRKWGHFIFSKAK